MNQSRKYSQNQGKSTIYYQTLTLGDKDWTLWASDKGLIRLTYPQDEGRLPAAWLKQYAPAGRLQEDRERFEQLGATALLQRYFAGEAVDFSGLALDLWGTPFQQEVWRGLLTIPYGKTATYKELAERIGRPQAMRAVGTANGQNPLPVIVPCHRVIGTNGTLTGYRGGLQLKQELLQLEGILHVKAAGHERFAF
ncbi:methylated-DNA--[protein]-cysteine S-methyltransferase [Paenibacillus sp. MMS20-IR301]|uniref:methylated-DNA--[protein]-cysteine S-methyltransferase n=1 Tax=Paenibacillus sp. MMS20-IR301 TaxID=2895946 RepID=UPI0028E1FFE2|nr:methylated-DNA--[protein]-cysteine S-methyltransferase [Paenibacillus sp. MMS20-IR301]WNS41960.1 methylated-DNA--[protein]-cysteine S-methyltransferase [Paenibacillus sp. MMS20-IR301]